MVSLMSVKKRLEKQYGALEKRLTHMPFTHTFTGSNPVRVTISLFINLFDLIYFMIKIVT